MRTQRGTPRLLAFTLTLMVLSTLAPGPAAGQVELPFEPPNPDSLLDELVREALGEANTTLHQANDTAPEHRAVAQGGVEFNRAVRFFQSGDLHLAVEHLSRVHAAAAQAIWETETEGSADQDAAIFTRSQDLFEETTQEISRIHERFGNLENSGVDPWLLDRALLAGDHLAQGQLDLFTYGGFNEAWNNGNRGEQARLGLIAWSNSAAFRVDLAGDLLRRSVATAPESPTGPVTSAETLHDRLEVWVPEVQEVKRSFDQQLTKIVNDNFDNNRTLASLGSLITLLRQQPVAVSQHIVQEEAFAISAEEAFQTLQDAMELPETLHGQDGLDVPGATNRTYLRAALQSYHTAANRMQDPNASDSNVILTVGDGLGAIAGHRFATSLLRQSYGQEVLDPIVFFPGDHVGESDDHGDEADGHGPNWGLILGGFAAVIVLILVVGRWMG